MIYLKLNNYSFIDRSVITIITLVDAHYTRSRLLTIFIMFLSTTIHLSPGYLHNNENHSGLTLLTRELKTMPSRVSCIPLTDRFSPPRDVWPTIIRHSICILEYIFGSSLHTQRNLWWPREIFVGQVLHSNIQGSVSSSRFFIVTKPCNIILQF